MNAKMSTVEIDGTTYKVAPEVAELLQAVSEERDELTSAMTASEAVYGFAAWLTCRQEAITLGAAHDAAPAADLVQRWCATNNLPPPRDEVYPGNITQPELYTANGEFSGAQDVRRTQ